MLKLEKIREVQDTGHLLKSRDLRWDEKTKVSHREQSYGRRAITASRRLRKAKRNHEKRGKLRAGENGNTFLLLFQVRLIVWEK